MPDIIIRGYSTYRLFLSLVVEVALAAIVFPAITIDLGPAFASRFTWTHVVFLSGNVAIAFGNLVGASWLMGYCVEFVICVPIVVDIYCIILFLVDKASLSQTLWWLTLGLVLLVVLRSGYIIRTRLMEVASKTDDHNLLVFINAAVYVGYALGSAIAVLLAEMRRGIRFARKAA